MHFTPVRLVLFALLSLLLCIGPAVAGPPVNITVYAASESDMLKRYSDAFHQMHKDVRITWVHDTGGAIISRLLAEKNNPQASAVFGLSLNGIQLLKQHGLLASYRPAGYDQISETMRDTSDPPAWTGMCAWVTALCVNEKMLKKVEVPVPASWQDLARPMYEGMIVMPHPGSSSTGFMAVWGWMQLWGPERAWEYAERLSRNVRLFVRSGSKPAAMVAQGEYPLGVSSPPFGKFFSDHNAPLSYVFPPEGTAWDLEASALIRHGEPLPKEKLEAAKKLLDFASSHEAAHIAATGLYIPARLDVNAHPQAGDRNRLIPMDAERAAFEREAILSHWRKLFGPHP